MLRVYETAGGDPILPPCLPFTLSWRMLIPLESLLASLERTGLLTMAIDLQAMARPALTTSKPVAPAHLVEIPDAVVRRLFGSSSKQVHCGLLCIAMRLDKPDINGTGIRAATRRYLAGIGYTSSYLRDALEHARRMGFARMLHSKPQYGRSSKH